MHFMNKYHKVSFPYYFIFDRIICVFVTFWERGHFVMLIIKNLHLINLDFWTYLCYFCKHCESLLINHIQFTNCAYGIKRKLPSEKILWPSGSQTITRLWAMFTFFQVREVSRYWIVPVVYKLVQFSSCSLCLGSIAWQREGQNWTFKFCINNNKFYWELGI